MFLALKEKTEKKEKEKIFLGKKQKKEKEQEEEEQEEEEEKKKKSLSPLLDFPGRHKGCDSAPVSVCRGRSIILGSSHLFLAEMDADIGDQAQQLSRACEMKLSLKEGREN